MVTKIGSRLLFVLVFVACVLKATTADLSFFDIQDTQIVQAEVGVPCKLVLTMQGAVSSSALPKIIKGLEKAQVSGAGTQSSVSITNGKRTQSLQSIYYVQFDQKGTYTVGPVEVTDEKGEKVVSNTIKLVVADTPAYKQKKSAQPVEFTLTVDKKKVYYGEKMYATLQLLYAKELVDIEYQAPHFTDFIVAQKEVKSKTGTLEREGTSYKFYEWTFELYPSKVGILSIGSAITQFTFAAPRHNFFDTHSFFDMLNGGNTHRLQSLPTSVEVIPLPKDQMHTGVSAVGDFKELIISLDQTNAQVGQGIVLSVELVGDGNMGMVTYDHLQLPDELAWYSAQSTVEPVTARSLEKKRFDFIVQAKQPGVYTIPPQKLVYFNPHTRTYKTLTSNSLSCTITGQAAVASPISDDTTLNDQTVDKQEVLENKTVSMPSLVPVKSFGISSGWYEILLILLGVACGIAVVYVSVLRTKIMSSKWVKRMRLKRTLKTMMHQARAHKKVSELLKAIEYAFASYANVVLQQDIYAYITNQAVWSAEEKQQMLLLYEQLLQAVYHKKVLDDFEHVYEKSAHLIQRLEEQA